jgi:hypothetical protein
MSCQDRRWYRYSKETSAVIPSRDPILESATKNGAFIKDGAQGTPEICLITRAQYFLAGG